MADNENRTEPQAEEPETPETAQPEPTPTEAPPTSQVSENIARSVDSLAEQVKSEREQADRARMTTLVVFVILIAVIVGYMSWLRAELKDKLSAEAVVQVAIVEGTNVMAQGMGVERRGRAWDELAIVVLDRRLEQLGDELITQLPRQEEEIAKQLRTGIDQGAEYGVQVLSDQVLPNLRRTSIDRIEGMMAQFMRQAEDEIRTAVDTVIEQNREDLAKLQDEEHIQASIGDAFEERIGDDMDKAFRKIGGHLGNAAERMQILAALMDGGNLTEEQQLEVLMIQVSHHWFSKMDDAQINEALNR